MNENNTTSNAGSAMQGRFSVIMHTLDNGALLSLRESCGYMRRVDAARHAARCAREYAARRAGAKVNHHASDRWVISNAQGISFAQFDVANN